RAIVDPDRPVEQLGTGARASRPVDLAEKIAARDRAALRVVRAPAPALAPAQPGERARTGDQPTYGVAHRAALASRDPQPQASPAPRPLQPVVLHGRHAGEAGRGGQGPGATKETRAEADGDGQVGVRARQPRGSVA